MRNKISTKCVEIFITLLYNLTMLLHYERKHNMKKEEMKNVGAADVAVQAKAPRKKFWKVFRDNLELLLLTLPGIVLCFIFNYLPMFGVVVAFKKFNPVKGIWGSDWIGLENFEFFFTSNDAFRIIRNTLLYGLDYMLIGMVCTVALALFMFNLKNAISLKVYNTIMILPKFLSMVLIAFIVYALLNPVSGVLNQVIAAFGGPNDIDWYAWPAAWPFILTIIHIWQTVGYGSILYYASLMGIDDSLFEAADLDGASTLQKTMHISIPHLVPIIVIQTILAMGSILNGDFGLHYQTTRDVGLLYPTTDIINTYTFRGLMNNSIGPSSAIGLFQSVIGLVMVVGVNLIVRKISPENSLF